MVALIYVLVSASANVTCSYNKKSYTNGQRFNNGCKKCTCLRGKVSCYPSSACNNKPGRCPSNPKVFSRGRGGQVQRMCRSTCTSDKTCNGNKKCCFNRICGRTSCMTPTRKSIGSDAILNYVNLSLLLKQIQILYFAAELYKHMD